MDLSAPQHPMMAQAERKVIQWTAFDPVGGQCARRHTPTEATPLTMSGYGWMNQSTILLLGPMQRSISMVSRHCQPDVLR